MDADQIRTGLVQQWGDAIMRLFAMQQSSNVLLSLRRPDLAIGLFTNISDSIRTQNVYQV